MLSLIAMCLVLSLSNAFAAKTTNHEEESNNDTASATVLEPDAITVGNLENESDIDYFVLTTETTGDILFHFSHSADGIYAYYWYAQVIDENNKVLLEGTLSGRAATDFSVKSVKPGNYYLRISRISGGNPLTNGFTTDPFMIEYSTKCSTHAELGDWVITKEPTCSEKGERVKICTACGTIVVTEDLDKLEHSFTDWSVMSDADLFKKGTMKRTCVLCGSIETKTFHSEKTRIAAYIGAGAIVLLIIIIVIVKSVNKKRRRRRSSYSGYSSNYNRYNSDSYGGSSSSNYYDPYSSNSSGESYSGSDYNDTTRVSVGTVNVDGYPQNVYNTDAEGYSTGPYIEDAEGYRTSVDPDTISPPFDWRDAD